MTLDDKELKAIKRYLETILNSDLVKNFNELNYIECETLRNDLEYIREILRLRKEMNDK